VNEVDVCDSDNGFVLPGGDLLLHRQKTSLQFQRRGSVNAVAVHSNITVVLQLKLQLGWMLRFRVPSMQRLQFRGRLATHLQVRVRFVLQVQVRVRSKPEHMLFGLLMATRICV